MRSTECIYWILFSLAIVSCAAVTPDTVIELFAPNEESELSSTPALSIFASKALFGPRFHFGKPSYSDDASIPVPIRLPPGDNPLLCNEPSSGATTYFSGTMLLIPKGGCTYQRKVYHAQLLGAKHAIIHATLADKYTSREQPPKSEYDTIYPTPYVDYDCENGRSYIPENELKFDVLPYDPANNDLLTGYIGDESLCALYHNLMHSSEEKRFRNICQSQRCVFTSNRKLDPTKLTFMRESCCAWDVYAVMGNDGSDYEVNISSIFLTMEGGDNVLRLMEVNSSVSAIVYSRSYPPVNLSSVLITFMAIAIVYISSRMSTQEYRILLKKLETVTVDPEDGNGEDPESPPMRNVVAINDNEVDDGENAVAVEALMVSNAVIPRDDIADDYVEVRHEPMSSTASSSRDDFDNTIAAEEVSVASDSASTSGDAMVPQNGVAPQGNNVAPLDIERNIDQENVEEEEDNWLRHRLDRVKERCPPRIRRMVTFAVLLGLAFFVLTRLLDILLFCYGFVGSFSIIYLLLRPGCQSVVDRINFMKPCRKGLCGPKEVDSLDILTVMAGLSAGCTWLYYAFSRTMEQRHPFYWIMQDLMNIAICIVTISNAHFKSIRIPIVILFMAFLYDGVLSIYPAIFRDFTPSFDDGFERFTSIETDYYRCEKYDDRKVELQCNMIRLPLVFLLPRANDYRGGWSSLGFVAVLFPGFVVSLVARYDTAKFIAKALEVREHAARRGIRNLINLMPNNESRRCFSGYFPLAISGYIIALAVAITVLALTRHSQLVMIYIVPLTVGPIVVKGFWRGDFPTLWSGPKRFRLADILISIIDQGGLASIDNMRLDDDDGSATVVTRSIISTSDSEKVWSDEENEEEIVIVAE